MNEALGVGGWQPLGHLARPPRYPPRRRPPTARRAQAITGGAGTPSARAAGGSARWHDPRMTSPAAALLLAFFLQEPVQAPPPEPERGLRLAEPGAADGYVLFSPLRARKTYLIDGKGEIRHTWDSPHPPLAVYLLADGTLLRVGRIDDNPTFHGGGLGGRIQRLAKDGSVLWEYVLSDAKATLHHDVEPLPNGNVLA